MSWTNYVPFAGGDPYADLVDGLKQVIGDHDALALLPYDDGTFFLKPANFNKELLGGQGGYETEDGDKIIMDGDGQPVKELFGVPMLLGVDPTEHAAAVDPIKALVAQKNNIGEWIRVDKKGNVVEVGEAVESVADYVDPEEYDDVSDINVGIEGSAVETQLAEMGLDADAATTQQVRRAMKQLAEDGKLKKIYDIATPGVVSANGDGEYSVEQATHYAVDQSKAADLLPTTTSTVEINTALDKARMEEHEEGQRINDITYGIIIGGVMVGVSAVLMFLLQSFL